MYLSMYLCIHVSIYLCHLSLCTHLSVYLDQLLLHEQLDEVLQRVRRLASEVPVLCMYGGGVTM